MKLTLKLCVLSASIFAASSAMAECPVEMPYNQLVDCITRGDSEADITDLMANAAEKQDTSILQLAKQDHETASSQK